MFQLSIGAVEAPFKRRELTTQLFFTSTVEFDVAPARDHPLRIIPEGHFTYTNQEDAIREICGLLSPARTVVDEPFDSTEDRSLVLTGSSVAHAITRRLMGDPWKGQYRFAYAGPGFECDFPYTVAQVKSEVWRYEDGGRFSGPDAAVVNKSGEVVAISSHDPSGKLTSDVLLVSRFPRRLGGSDYIVYAGLHGPSMLAIATLLRSADLDDLQFLTNMLGENRHFQAIFRVHGLRDENGMTRPGFVTLERTGAAAPKPVITRTC